MLVGAFHFPTDYGIEIGELARALEERGLKSLLSMRTHAYSRQPALALSGRRRAA